MSIQTELFGNLPHNKSAYLYTIKNINGMFIKVSNYGALLTSLVVKNLQGQYKDIVLGYDNLEDYFDNSPLFGAIVGRNINRISNAQFEIDGHIYNLIKNRGIHNIHSDKEHGFHKVLWKTIFLDENSISFSYFSPDQEQNFPGNLSVNVTYTLTNSNALIISIRAISDKTTLINISNHNYFNLSGHDSGDILNTELLINSNFFTPVDKYTIPTGEIRSVLKTPFDFTYSHKIKNDIFKNYNQLKIANGFDHNFVLNNPNIGLRKIAQAKNSNEGISMDVYSDSIGLQFYTGNNLSKIKGKNNVIYDKYSGFCLEPQYFPNSINTDNFEKPIFNPNEEFKTTVIYQFT